MFGHFADNSIELVKPIRRKNPTNGRGCRCTYQPRYRKLVSGEVSTVCALGPRRIRHFSGFGSSSNGEGEGRAKRPVLIALIDPKPLTRQSLLEMLAGALPEHVVLVGASCLSELLEKTEQTERFPNSSKFYHLIYTERRCERYLGTRAVTFD